jgi:hypothetical protein
LIYGFLGLIYFRKKDEIPSMISFHLENRFDIEAPYYLTYKYFILPCIFYNLTLMTLQLGNIIKNVNPYASKITAFLAGVFVANNINCAQTLKQNN